MADGKYTEKYTRSEVGHDESWPENLAQLSREKTIQVTVLEKNVFKKSGLSPAAVCCSKTITNV